MIHKAPAHYGYRTARYKLIYYYNDGFGLPFTSFCALPAGMGAVRPPTPTPTS